MKSRQFLFASIGCAFALLSAQAFGDSAFPKATEVLHIDDGGVYSTDWTAYPLRVEQVGPDNQRPVQIVLGVFQDGKEGGFQGIVQINCDRPVQSYVNTGTNGVEQFNGVPLKNLMKRATFPRKLVSNLFAVFCTGATLDSAALDMKRD